MPFVNAAKNPLTPIRALGGVCARNYLFPLGLSTSLTTSKLNAVRAAFRAGVKPRQIGRQFGLSDADVRKALAGDWKR